MLEHISLSVALPASREAQSLTTLLPAMRAELANCIDSFEIIVIDSRETFDDTSDVCVRFGVRHIRQREGDTYGDAVRTGIAEARGEYVLFMDADGSHDPESIVKMWQLRRDYDIVIGSRYVIGGRSENGPLLVVLSQLLGLAFWLTFNLPIADATTSYRLYRGEMLRGLKLEAKGFDILQEILLKSLAGPSHARVFEIPISFVKRTAGSSKRHLVRLAIAYLKTFVKLKRFQTNAAIGSSEHSPFY